MGRACIKKETIAQASEKLTADLLCNKGMALARPKTEQEDSGF
jgi:hypothetical protein